MAGDSREVVAKLERERGAVEEGQRRWGSFGGEVRSKFWRR